MRKRFAGFREPKRDGGLGVRDIEAFNDALLAKQGWRILKKPGCLLAKVLLGKYCKTESLLDVEASNSCSHGWRSILCCRDVIHSNTTRTIGNGVNTKVWREAWCSTEAVISPIGPPELATNDLKVSDLFYPDTTTWNKELIQQILPREAPSILCIKPSKTGASDSYSWILTANGEYSTKSGYYVALDNYQPATPTTMAHQNQCDWNRDIWKLQLPLKLRVFLWKAIRGALPIGANLETRGLTTNTTCVFCGMRETLDHLFLLMSICDKYLELGAYDQWSHHLL